MPKIGVNPDFLDDRLLQAMVAECTAGAYHHSGSTNTRTNQGGSNFMVNLGVRQNHLCSPKTANMTHFHHLPIVDLLCM